MEDMDFGRTLIDGITTTSSDESTETSIDASLQISIDDTPPEAGKFSLTNHVNEEVVLGEPKSKLSNAINQIINEQVTAIIVKINSSSNRDKETTLPLQDYLNSGRTYSNRSAIKLPKDDTKKYGLSLEYLILVRQNPFRRTISECPHDHIEYLEDMMNDDTRSPEEAKRLIKNVATEEQNQFGIYHIDDDVLSDLEQHVDFIDIPTLKDWYPNHDTDSFTRNYDGTDGSRRGRAKFRQQVAENATAIRRETRRLPRRTDANPRHQVNVVLLRSGKRLTPSSIDINYVEKPGEVAKTGESRSRPILLDNPDPGSEPFREKE
ncbi:hypothetical protein F2Q69_00021868 [Brassica cretica]|uniref:Uncharacterized protein n=1 Tax=Brassica cretica TaxID=69181 RepID=A0A8S9QJC9_BRACR|nr:hypothetical protein F2Q69_00021868 [Brassica cretica]